MNASFEIRLDTAKLAKLERAQIQALEMTAEALHTEIVQAQVMPRDTGNLQNDSTFVDTSRSNQGTVSIVTDTPYARRLYFHPEYNFRTDKNPNAKGLWLEDWMQGGINESFVKDTYTELYRRLTGI